MKNYKIIITVVFSQIVLIFASFKSPTIKGNNAKEGSKTTVLNEVNTDKKLVASKTFKIEQPNFTLDYHYPYLKEASSNFNDVFNDYVKKNIVEPGSKLNDESPICEMSNGIKTKSLLDYKDYFQDEDLLSILLFKRDFYKGDEIPLYSFKTLNFDLTKGEFVKYETFFKDNTETKLVKVLNNKLSSNSNHYECWELTESQFEKNKSNYTLSENAIKFYFDDCAICPSHSGEFAVEVPYKEISNLILNPAL